MFTSEHDELLIQRCVDSELSTAETQKLLLRLERLDCGWKQLACAFLEDRCLQRAFSHQRSSHPEAAPTAKPVVGKGTQTEKVRETHGSRHLSVRHWWSHPVMSLALSTAIAFVGGMLVHDTWRDSTSTVNSTGIQTVQADLSVDAKAGNQTPSYRVQWPTHGAQYEVPAFGVTDVWEMDRNHPLFSDDQSGVSWMIVPAGETRSMLIPVSANPAGNFQ